MGEQLFEKIGLFGYQETLPFTLSNYPLLEEELLSICQTTPRANGLWGDVYSLSVKQIRTVYYRFPWFLSIAVNARSILKM